MFHLLMAEPSSVSQTQCDQILQCLTVLAVADLFADKLNGLDPAKLRAVAERGGGMALLPAQLLDKVSDRLLPGDRFLLCSDGRCKTLPENELASLLAAIDGTPPQAVIDVALALDASDNVTAVMVEVTWGPDLSLRVSCDTSTRPGPAGWPRLAVGPDGARPERLAVGLFNAERAEVRRARRDELKHGLRPPQHLWCL